MSEKRRNSLKKRLLNYLKIGNIYLKEENHWNKAFRIFFLKYANICIDNQQGQYLSGGCLYHSTLALPLSIEVNIGSILLPTILGFHVQQLEHKQENKLFSHTYITVQNFTWKKIKVQYKYLKVKQFIPTIINQNETMSIKQHSITILTAKSYFLTAPTEIFLTAIFF